MMAGPMTEQFPHTNCGSPGGAFWQEFLVALPNHINTPRQKRGAAMFPPSCPFAAACSRLNH